MGFRICASVWAASADSWRSKVNSRKEPGSAWKRILVDGAGGYTYSCELLKGGRVQKSRSLSNVATVKVSIIEDDDWIRENLVSLINQAPGFCCVSSFSTGEEALDCIGKGT